MKPTRTEAWTLLTELNHEAALRNHALAVEAVMRHMARKAGGDEEEWGIIGLVHDLDYERWPEQHCHKSRELLEARGWPPDYVRAIMSHGGASVRMWSHKRHWKKRCTRWMN
jgi:putative nucleotidyltransferase with HDIG domain